MEPADVADAEDDYDEADDDDDDDYAADEDADDNDYAAAVNAAADDDDDDHHSYSSLELLQRSIATSTKTQTSMRKPSLLYLAFYILYLIFEMICFLGCFAYSPAFWI